MDIGDHKVKETGLQTERTIDGIYINLKLVPISVLRSTQKIHKSSGPWIVHSTQSKLRQSHCKYRNPRHSARNSRKLARIWLGGEDFCAWGSL